MTLAALMPNSASALPLWGIITIIVVFLAALLVVVGRRR